MTTNETIRIALIGDIFPAEREFSLNYGIKSQFENHKGKPWIKKINNIIGTNDLIIGNLESPLVNSDEALKKKFYGSPDFALFLKECGINVLNVANNHIMEQGDNGFKSTITALKNAGLGIVGNIVDSTSNVLYLNIKGLKVGIAGFSNVDLHKIINKNHFAVLNEDNVLNSLQQMDDHLVDLKLLCFHWGNEYIHIPSTEQRNLAYKFIDAGANIIVGHHPHVIQPYEQYKNGHIFFSLGNFIFDYIHSKNFSIGLVTTLEITKSKQIHVNLAGVKLSYKNTVVNLPDYKFEKYHSRITKQYEQLSKCTNDEYQKYYNSLLKKNRFLQRFLMKKSLINEFFKIKGKDKLFLIRNLLTYYSILITNTISRKQSA